MVIESNQQMGKFNQPNNGDLIKKHVDFNQETCWYNQETRVQLILSRNTGDLINQQKCDLMWCNEFKVIDHQQSNMTCCDMRTGETLATLTYGFNKRINTFISKTIWKCCVFDKQVVSLSRTSYLGEDNVHPSAIVSCRRSQSGWTANAERNTGKGVISGISLALMVY